MTNITLGILSIIVSYAIGKRFLRLIRLQISSANEDMLFSIGLGFGIISYSIFFLGIFGILYKWIIWILVIGIIVFLFNEIKSFFLSIPQVTVKCIQVLRNTSLFYKFIVILLVGYFAVNMIGALAPSTAQDPLTYNLLAPKRFLSRHSIFLVPDSVQSNWPISIEMLYLFAIAIKGDILAKVIHYVMGFFATLTIIHFSNKHLHSLSGGILASIIFYSQPVVEKMSTMAKIDLGMCFYFLLMVFALFNWIYFSTNGDNKWLLVSSIFLGLSASAKLTGVLSFPLFFMAVFLVYLLIKKAAWYIAIRKTIIFTLIGFLVVLPWYIKLYYFFGDPLYPLLSQGLSSQASPDLNMTISQYFRIPWDMVFHIDKFPYGNTRASVIFLAFLPFPFFIKRKEKNILILLLLSLVWITMFFIAGGITSRWILPALALLSVVYAFSINTFFQKSGIPLKIFIMILLNSYFLLNFGLTSRWRLRTYVPVVFGFETKDNYLSRSQEYYDVYKYINNNLPRDAKIYAPWETRAYYLEREFITGNSEFDENFDGLETCEDLIEKMKNMVFTNVLLNKNYHNIIIKMYEEGKLITTNPKDNLFFKPCMDKYLQLLYCKNNVCVYKIL